MERIAKNFSPAVPNDESLKLINHHHYPLSCQVDGVLLDWHLHYYYFAVPAIGMQTKEKKNILLAHHFYGCQRLVPCNLKAIVEQRQCIRESWHAMLFVCWIVIYLKTVWRYLFILGKFVCEFMRIRYSRRHNWSVSIQNTTRILGTSLEISCSCKWKLIFLFRK